MYCRACRYDLRELESRVCPECSRVFDPENPRTYLQSRYACSLWVSWVVFLACFIQVGGPLLLNPRVIHLWAIDPWESYSQDRFDQAIADHEIIIVFFKAEWDVSSNSIERYFDNPELRNLLWRQEIDVLHVDLTGNNKAGYQLLEDLGRIMGPTIVIYDRKGEVVVHSGAGTLYSELTESVRAAIRH